MLVIRIKSKGANIPKDEIKVLTSLMSISF